MEKSTHPRDHMANERTFLAWIRTSIGIMAFGFVVEKFSLFLKHLNLWLAKEQMAPLIPPPHVQGLSSLFGVLLVGLGVVICLLSFFRYKKVEKQIKNEKYEPSVMLNIMLTLSVLSIGIFLVIYLNNNL